jgi:arginyl-tRNA synthetase
MIEKILAEKATEAICLLFGHQLDPSLVTVQKTRPEFEGDLTIVIFPLTRFSGKSPEETGKEIGKWLQQNIGIVSSFNVVKGFLNLMISDDFWIDFFSANLVNPAYGFSPEDNSPPVVPRQIQINLYTWGISGIIYWAGPLRKY